jgi:hypothetical protein
VSIGKITVAMIEVGINERQATKAIIKPINIIGNRRRDLIGTNSIMVIAVTMAMGMATTMALTMAMPGVTA